MSALSALDLELDGNARVAQVARVLAPRASAGGGSVPPRTLLLLHGLGETKSRALALKAWSELYGLVTADARLRKPPVVAIHDKPSYWTAERLLDVNRSLVQHPYRGFVLVCPQTPNPAQVADRNKLFDDYTTWLLQVLLPEVERRYPGATKSVQLDGCSLGGYVALEVFSRQPQRFAALGTVQCAIGAWRAPKYAERLAAASPRVPLRISSSTRDPFLEANQQLSKELTKRAVKHELDVIPGPHDQPWLREVGTLEMLRWHDQVGRANG